MKHSLKPIFWAVSCIALAALLTAPALAGSSSSRDDERSNLIHPGDVIYSGADLWVTADDGMTYSSFLDNPIPAGFFCEGSEPFSGVMALKGGGLNTVPQGILGEADTIIHRMDDAVFDKDGVAYTRVKFLALSLASAEPVQTGCGQFQAAIRLKGEQPVTSMRIERTEPNGGFYSATLSVNARVIFTPLQGEASKRLELEQNIRFAPNHSVWARQNGTSAQAVQHYARVDVDGDGHAETVIPGPSNFRPGYLVKDGALARATFQEISQAVAIQPCLATVPPNGTPTMTCPRGCHCSQWASFDDDDDLNDACLQTTQCIHCHCTYGFIYPGEEAEISN
ncbi:MAG: hypothetical protein V3T83_10480 [Acidobacteriota bacterium]